MINLFRAIAAATCVACALPASAQQYPARLVRIIVGFAPGGGTDMLARGIGTRLYESLGQPVVVENRAGATGTIAADYVAKLPPDGYTILLGSVNSNAIAPSVYRKLPYNPLKDFTSIAYVGYAPNVLVVHPALPVRNVKELIALAKAKTGELSSASAGPGSTQHLALEMFNTHAHVKIVHVPYKGSGQAVTDLLAGHVQMNFDVLPPIVPHVRSGRLRALAATTIKRASQLPDTPTLDESGLKGFDLSNWYSFFGPAGMPKDVTAKLNREINRILQETGTRKRFTDAGTEISGDMTPDALDAYVRAETAKFAKVVKDAGVQLD